MERQDDHDHAPAAPHAHAPAAHGHGHDHGDVAHGERAHGHGGHDHAGHDHGHGAHGHHHELPDKIGRAFVIGIGLNLAFVVVESVYGVLAHSLALVADAGHNLGDVLGLALSWGATVLAKRRPTKRRTYGLRGGTILASLTNALVLLFVTGGIAWESARRFFEPGAAVASTTMIVVSLVGVVVNGSSAALFLAGRHGDLNVRSAFMHLASDAALALSVAVAGVVIAFTGWWWLDPLMSIVLSVVILVSTFSLLRDSLDLALHAVPTGIEPDAVRAYLGALPKVREVHDLHIWAMSTTETALTAHLVVAPSCAIDPLFLGDACRELQARFGIHHSTLQLEPTEAPSNCRLAADESI